MYSGYDGFLGTRASFMLDFVAVALFGILALLAFSIWLVRQRQAYDWHKRIQLLLAVTLGATVLVFEYDMRRNGWQDRARESGYFGTLQKPGLVYKALYVHLVFSISTTLLWVGVIAAGLRKFPSPPRPAGHSPTHRLWGWLAAIDLAGTAVTGWIFYWLAFVA